MGEVDEFTLASILERHAVVDCVEERFVFLQQWDSFGKVMVPFYEAHGSVEWRMYDGR